MTELSTDNGYISLEEFYDLCNVVEAIKVREGGNYTLEIETRKEYPEHSLTFVKSCILVYREPQVNYAETRRTFDLSDWSEATLVTYAMFDANPHLKPWEVVTKILKLLKTL